jgi:hypothetical protein
MTMARTFDQLVAIGKETVFGTAVAPTIATPVTEFSAIPQNEEWFDEGRRGLPSMAFDAVQGVGHSEFTIEGTVYPEDIGHLLMMIFGQVTTTGAADPWSHEFTIAAGVPPSYTIIDRTFNAASGNRQFAGCRVGELVVSWNAGEGVFGYRATGIGLTPTIVAADATVAAPDTPWPGWNAVVTSAGLTGLVASGEITFSRELQVVHTGADSQDPRHINVGQIDVRGNVLATIEDDLTGAYTAFLNATRQSFQVLFDIVATNRSLDILLTDADLAAEPIELDRGGVGVFNRVNFRGIHNATDGGPAEVNLENGVASY